MARAGRGVGGLSAQPPGAAGAGRTRALAAAVLAAGLPAQPAPAAEPIAVPSGQPVSLLQMFVEPQAGTGEVWARFRYLAPAIAADAARVTYRLARADMDHLCDHHALPTLAARGLAPDLIVVSLSASPTGFGETAPDTIQYFETYSIAGDRCRLETY